MKQVLSAWVDQEEDRYRLTLEALDDVDSAGLSTSRRSRRGQTALSRMNLCRFRADGVAMETSSGLSALARLYEFLAAVNKGTAART